MESRSYPESLTPLNVSIRNSVEHKLLIKDSSLWSSASRWFSNKIESRISKKISSSDFKTANSILDKVDPANKPILNVDGNGRKLGVQKVRQGGGLDRVVSAQFHDILEEGNYAVNADSGSVIIDGISFRTETVKACFSGRTNLRPTLSSSESIQVPLINPKDGKVHIFELPVKLAEKIAENLHSVEIQTRITVGDVGVGSNIGKVRETDEDSYCAMVRNGKPMYRLANNDLPNANVNIVATQEGLVHDRLSKLMKDGSGIDSVLMLADGMGGHGRGEYASQRVVVKILDGLSEVKGWDNLNPDQVRSKLKEVVSKAARDFHRDMQTQNGDYGSTLAMGIIVNGKAYPVHTGDSRLYLMAGGQLSQLTEDHTPEKALREIGMWTEGGKVPLTSFMGKKDARIDVGQPIEFKGDAILAVVCDGVTDEVNDAELTAILSSSKSSADIVNDLIKVANEKGGRDNITAVIARLHN